MQSRWALWAVALAAAGSTGGLGLRAVQPPAGGRPQPKAPFDAVTDAQTPRTVATDRPEQRKTPHDDSDQFKPNQPAPLTPAFADQPDGGRMLGFDFARDPLNAKKPMQSFEETMREDVAGKPKVTAQQRKLLESRYTLTPRHDPTAKMSRGKPLPVGPTARLKDGMNWDRLAGMTPDQIKQ